MKSEKRKYTVLTWMFVFACLLFGKGMDNVAVDKVSKPSSSGPTQSVININNMAHWITKSTGYTISGSVNGCQVDYPIGTGGLIFADGIVWGGMVHDGGVQELRVGGTTYADGVKAGRVVYDGAGNVIGSTEPADHHVWRVRKDYKTADLTADASNYFQVIPPAVADAGQIQEVYVQYEYDWNNWPATWGAPFNDVDGDGLYDPTVDIPGYPGADQTIWVIANDIPQIVDENGNALRILNTSQTLYGADPIGMELQLTLWAYKYGGGDPFGNIVFKSAKMKYVGLPGGPADATIDRMYISQWSDPDLGNSTDDYVGCDIDLSLGFAYNGTKKDNIYQGIYNLPVPAGGYDFLQGPIVDGTPLPMTSFTYFGAGSAISDPTLSSYSGSGQFYNLMEGFLPRPEYPVQEPFTDLSTGEITKFVLSGDPIGGGGWVDGVQLPPGDRRLVMSSGPFEMVLGEEKEIVLALVGGIAKDALTSLGVVKYYDLSAQYAFDIGFDLPAPPEPPQIVSFGKDKAIGLNWGSNTAAVDATELPVSKGFAFEGYSLYQLPSLNAPLTEGVKLETWDVINDVATVFDKGVDPSTGYVLDLPKQPGRNSGLTYFYEADYDELRGRPMSNGIVYYYALTAYSYKADKSPEDPFITIESTPARISVTPHSINPGTSVPADFGDLIKTTQTGTANISADVMAVNTDALNGHEYKIWFNQNHYYLDLDGYWKITAEPDAIAKLLDVSPSTVTGSAVVGPGGTIDLNFEVHVVSPDYDYAAGVLITIPGAVINSASSADGFVAVVQADGQSVLFGDLVMDGAGDFAGGEVVTINVVANSVALPIAFDYEIYDDAWATLVCDSDLDGIIDAGMEDYCNTYGLGPGNSVIANATGSGIIDVLGYSFKTIKYWNLTDVTTSEDILEEQWVMNGMALDHIDDGVFYEETGVKFIGDAPPIIDGFRINDVKGGYAAPMDFLSITSNGADVDVGFNQGAGVTTYNIDSYFGSGWEADATALTTYGTGFSSVDILQRDVKVVFDGVLGNPITTATGASYFPVVEGGSQAWIFQGNTLATHPANPNPGSGDPFLLDVPFKVFDVEDPENPVQISMIIRDRIQTYDGSDTELYAFNPDDRIYTWFVNRPYEETLNDFASNEAFLTWNVVWWNQQWTAGDELTFLYPNPVQIGVDELAWTTEGFATGGDVTQDEIDMIQVYPNPYYGFQETEISRTNKFVGFNHLPQKATIRIFTIGGTMVRQIEKDDATQFARWDLTNQYQYPVASGIYIIHIETEHGEKILKLALVQETQVLKFY